MAGEQDRRDQATHPLYRIVEALASVLAFRVRDLFVTLPTTEVEVDPEIVNGRHSVTITIRFSLPAEGAVDFTPVADPSRTVADQPRTILDAFTPRTARPQPNHPPGRNGLAEFLRGTYPDIFARVNAIPNPDLADHVLGVLATRRAPAKPASSKPIPFGKYFLLEKIDEDAISEYFLARTYGVEGFEKLLVIKRIKPDIADDEEFILMFIDEQRITAQLNHANITQVFDLGKINDSYFIALEYVCGMSVREIIGGQREREAPLPIPLACHIIGQACEALDYAHQKKDATGREWGIVHRDVCLENILVSFDGDVKVTNFGIAKAAHKVSKTQAGLLKGKFGYMSPEQVRGLPLDRRSDIFSLGIVLYELLTNKRLFVGESDFATLEKVRNVDVRPPSTVNKYIPPDLDRIVMKALSKDLDERYQTAAEFGDDLQHCLAPWGKE